MLSTRTIRELHEALRQSDYFRSGDFHMVTTGGERGTILLFEYRYDPTMMLKVVVPAEKNGDDIFLMSGEVCPGEVSAVEPVHFGGLDALKRGVVDWLGRVKGEILAEPVLRQIMEQEERLAQFRFQLTALPDEYFSMEEAGQLRQRLDDLERRLSENLKANVADRSDLSARLKEVAADVRMLKDSAGSLTKPGWVGALGTRTFNWLRDPVNRKLMVSGADVAKELLAGVGQRAA
jgi:hypothetical protein